MKILTKYKNIHLEDSPTQRLELICVAAPSCRLFDTSMGHNHEEAQSRITSSSAASSNARCSGKRAAAFASFEDSLQKTRHRACVKRHAASGFAA